MENKERDEVVQKTMKAIVDVLVERNNAYQEAYKLATHDPEIDLSRTEHQYQPPSSYEAEVRKPRSLFRTRLIGTGNHRRRSAE